MEGVFQALREERAKVDNKAAICKQKILDHIRDKGIKDFVETFVSTLNDVHWMVDPEEFFDDLYQMEYTRQLFEFKLDFYRRYMTTMQPTFIAERIIDLAEGPEIIPEVLDKMGL